MKALISKEKGEEYMKKLVLLLVALFGAFALVGCVSGEILVDEAHDYYATGQFAGWGDAVGNEDFLMEAIARNDERIKSIVKETKGAKFLYLIEITLPDTAAGWDFTYKIDGEDVTFDGNQSLKMIRTDAGDEVPNWWGQSPESGKMDNLTPETLYIPPFVEENVDNAGGWNDNPGALEAGTYYFVYVKFEESQAFALIEK
jgi:hypothetical protein